MGLQAVQLLASDTRRLSELLQRGNTIQECQHMRGAYGSTVSRGDRCQHRAFGMGMKPSHDVVLTIIERRKMRAIEPKHCQHRVIHVMHLRQATEEFFTRDLHTSGLEWVSCATFNHAGID